MECDMVRPQVKAYRSRSNTAYPKPFSCENFIFFFRAGEVWEVETDMLAQS